MLAAIAWTLCRSEHDRVLRKPIGWSQGFVKEDKMMFSPNDESFGHPGAGGRHNPRARDLVHPKQDGSPHSITRARALTAAIYACIES